MHYEPFGETIRRQNDVFEVAKTDFGGYKSDSWQRPVTGDS